MQIKIVSKSPQHVTYQPDRYFGIAPMPLICNDTTEIEHAKSEARKAAIVWRNNYVAYLVTFDGAVLGRFEYFEEN